MEDLMTRAEELLKKCRTAEGEKQVRLLLGLGVSAKHISVSTSSTNYGCVDDYVTVHNPENDEDDDWGSPY